MKKILNTFILIQLVFIFIGTSNSFAFSHQFSINDCVSYFSSYEQDIAAILQNQQAQVVKENHSKSADIQYLEIISELLQEEEKKEESEKDECKENLKKQKHNKLNAYNSLSFFYAQLDDFCKKGLTFLDFPPYTDTFRYILFQVFRL